MKELSLLFVDDEPRILKGLEMRLHRWRRRWQLHFVDSGKAALDLLEREPIDVLITDMRMPEMDGAALLAHVQLRYPSVVRIVLSGHADLDCTLRAMPVAHQYLSKPCDPGTLERVVERTCQLRALVNSPAVQQTVGSITSLPSLPRVYAELNALLGDEEASSTDVARVLEQDMALCAKVLQLVNSAFFRLSRPLSKVDEAVRYLGANSIRHVALAVELFGEGGKGGALELSPELLHAHALEVGAVASHVLSDSPLREDAFVAGLLHDVGKLLLAAHLPERLEQASTLARERGCLLHEAEASLFGVTHAEIGAYLLGLWGLPYPIVEAVAHHHAPMRLTAEPGVLGLLAAVHLGNGLSDPAALDETFVASLALPTGQLDAWREAYEDRRFS